MGNINHFTSLIFTLNTSQMMFRLYKSHLIHSIQIQLGIQFYPKKGQWKFSSSGLKNSNLWRHFNVTRLDRNLLTFRTAWQRKNTYPNFKDMQREMFIQGAASAFLHVHKMTGQPAGQILTGLHVQKPISNKNI